MNIAEVEKGLEGLRKGLKADGADLLVQNLDEACIELSLVLGESACLECIVSTEILTAKVRTALGKILPQVPKILLHDPRKTDAAP